MMPLPTTAIVRVRAMLSLSSSATHRSGNGQASFCALLRDELLLRELADRGLGQARAELHLGRHLVAAELVPQERLELVETEALAGLERNEGLGGLAAIGVGHADHRHLRHRGMLVDRLLDD